MQIEETLANVESKIHSIDEIEQDEFRSKIVLTLQNYCINKKEQYNNTPDFLTIAEYKTKLFLKNNKSIIENRADKGNTTVIMKHELYTNKCIKFRIITIHTE